MFPYTHIDIENQFIQLAKKYNYKNSEGKKILRSTNKKPFFTFSPMLDVIDKFTDNSTMQGIYNAQFCIKSIEVYRLLNNPLANNSQRVLSLYNPYQHDISQVFSFCSDFFFNIIGLEKDRIHVLFSEDNPYLQEILHQYQFFNTTQSKSSVLMCKIPNFENKAFYVKFLYFYKNGLVPICNLVLINQEDRKAMIDSVFFLERLTFIKEKKHNIYETYLYSNTLKTLKLHLNRVTDEELCTLAALLRQITILFYEGLLPNNKNANYVLRKIIREFFNLIVDQFASLNEYTVTLWLQSALHDLYIYDPNYFSKPLPNIYNIFYKELETYYSNSQKNLQFLINTGKLDNFQGYISYEDFLKIKDTYGLPYQFLKKYCESNGIILKDNPKELEFKNRTLPYPYPSKKNNEFSSQTWIANSRYGAKYK
ncbi:alanine--tRNA ligase-related protein [Bacillus sp. MHSD_36]|uniref:alanine--tRNA ligase-related protein n=1 Tax=unclassified Bacillus (in: firmicutes) TaxID=185979 RepID=UPI0027425EE8|nr:MULTISPECIES: alanine--tRNA ligase-related protein [unclassified Bacillus (in: firmicutes)]MDP7992177.1 alanine--tRNA ligase-related protein [Bacillus sp. MHSD_36]MDR4980967.1 alanine--tRNA ligase-related protein [Bacillus sp. MHSD_37]